MGRPSLRTRKQLRTRTQIADAARECFRRKGYEATTLEDVAEIAEIHKRTLLRYFPSKAHLILHPQYAALESLRNALENRGERLAIDVWEDHVVYYSRRQREDMRELDLSLIAAGEPAVIPASLSIQSQYRRLLESALCVDYGWDPATDVPSKVIASALAGGSFAVAGMILAREAYEQMETANREVLRIVREKLLAQLAPG